MTEKPIASTERVVDSVQPSVRVRVFIDYWNFQLSLNEIEGKVRKLTDFRFKIDWRKLGPWLASKACDTVGVGDHSFDGAIVYTSYNPLSIRSRGFQRWAKTWLDRQPGIMVHCRERRPKAPPKCPECYEPILTCPKCAKKMVGSQEKGVDSFIVTDLIRLAWEDAYDVAVLATSDSDLVPAVEFLNQKARKVIQAGFPPAGVNLATACWASFDVSPHRAEIERA